MLKTLGIIDFWSSINPETRIYPSSQSDQTVDTNLSEFGKSQNLECLIQSTFLYTLE